MRDFNQFLMKLILPVLGVAIRVILLSISLQVPQLSYACRGQPKFSPTLCAVGDSVSSGPTSRREDQLSSSVKVPPEITRRLNDYSSYLLENPCFKFVNSIIPFLHHIEWPFGQLGNKSNEFGRIALAQLVQFK